VRKLLMVLVMLILQPLNVADGKAPYITQCSTSYFYCFDNTTQCIHDIHADAHIASRDSQLCSSEQYAHIVAVSCNAASSTAVKEACDHAHTVDL
jgi:hypothetical protein